MIKVIPLSYMINGHYGNGEPCKDIETQVQDTLDNNPNYKYNDLIYKSNERAINMQYATLIVDVCDNNINPVKKQDLSCVVKTLGIAETVGELKKMLSEYPDDTSFGFRNQPMQELREVEHAGDKYVVFQEI